MNRIDASNKDSYYFFVASRAILCAPDLSDTEKLVYIALHGRENVEMHGDPPSMRNVAEWLGKDRRSVRRAIDGLEAKGYAAREYARSERGCPVVNVTTVVPAQAAEAGKRYLKRGFVSISDDSEGGDATSPPRGGRHVPTPGGTPRPSLGVDTGKKTEAVKRPSPSGEGPTEGSGSNVLAGKTLDELKSLLLEIHAALRGLNGDGDSAEVQALRERERSVREAIRSARRSPPLPSTRPKWNRWRGRDPSRWVAADLLGYWICRYREVRGEEDPRHAACDASYDLRMTRTCERYRDANLDGSGDRWKEAVEKILTHAADRGRPVSLQYFAVISNPGILESLDKPQRSRGAPSPVELNDAHCVYSEAWERKAEEWAKRNRERLEREAAG